MLALLFPGQGSQEVGMGREVVHASSAGRETFEAADDALGFALSKICFEGPEEELRRTETVPLAPTRATMRFSRIWHASSKPIHWRKTR